MQTRRDVIASLGIVASTSLAGCTDGLTETDSGENETDGGLAGEGTSSAPTVGAQTAGAAQWNVYRARVFDAVALGRAGQASVGVAVAESIFSQFDGATGEFGAHELLEETNHDAYEGFEGTLATLQSSLSDGDVDAAADAAATASGQLQAAQQAAAGNPVTLALDLLWFAGRGANAAFLADAGRLEAATAVASEAYEDFEDALVHGKLETADHETYETFEHGLEDAATAAEAGDAEAIGEHVESALEAAVEGAYALADTDAAAGAGHLSTLQASGYDAAVLSGLGGPGESFADAASLNVYRARAYDAEWLAAQGGTDAATTMAEDVCAHFEGADHEADEGFEGGLEDLSAAIANGDGSAVDGAVGTVDSNLVTGIQELAGENGAAVQSGFFRARFADALELYKLGSGDAAATVVGDLFERFENDELGFHEALEHQSEDRYHRFEEEHLPALKTAFSDGDDASVSTHYDGVQAALLEFEAVQSEAVASGAETGYMLGRGFDAAAVASLGNGSRAEAIVENSFEHFESGAAGFREALEHADHDTYEAFETELGALKSAASDDGDVYGAAKSYNDRGIAGIHSIVTNAGESNGSAAAAIVEDVFATFEQASVHETLETADHDAYEGFEQAIEDYASALKSGEADPSAFANAARTAQFAVVGAADEAPAASGQSHSEDTTDEEEEELSGGPNVVDGVPGDADRVVKANAVSFQPAELTVTAGDTVAFTHGGGEAHTVTANAQKIPDDAEYWASGEFDSAEAARAGWKEGEGAVKSGQSYLRTFETVGEHYYLCIPHEAAGMTGEIIVEA